MATGRNADFLGLLDRGRNRDRRRDKTCQARRPLAANGAKTDIIGDFPIAVCQTSDIFPLAIFGDIFGNAISDVALMDCYLPSVSSDLTARGAQSLSAGQEGRNRTNPLAFQRSTRHPLAVRLGAM